MENSSGGGQGITLPPQEPESPESALNRSEKI
jgi:hypothetical protein